MRALVTGATGFVGRRLLERLDAPVQVLSRDPARAERSLGPGRVTAHRWGGAGPVPAAAFDDVEAVFHLAGESLADGRWTDDKKQRIRDSRIEGTRHLVDAIGALERRPAVLVSASAVGFYGDRGDEVLDESSSSGRDFLAEVCRGWEAEAARAASFGVRVVSLRFGIVLGANGGALDRMLLPFKLGVGGRLGSGRQWMPWVHLDDVVGLLCFAAERADVSGVVNATAPGEVTNATFTKELAGELHRPAVLPVPPLALRLALGEFADVLLASQRVQPRRASELGYAFQHPTLDGALAASLARAAA